MKYPTVAFMGLDGTGKSSHAELFRAAAAQRGERWVVLHHSSTRVPVLAGLKRRYHGAAVRMLKRRRAHVNWEEQQGGQAGGGSAASRLISAYILAGSVAKAVWFSWRYRRAQVILDRCVLDDIVKVRWRFGCFFASDRAVIRSTPRPDVVIVLHGDPAVTYERKKAQNCTYMEYLKKGELLEQCLAEAADAGWRIRRVAIDGKSLDQVHQEVSAVLHGQAHDGMRDRNQGAAVTGGDR